ncbi:MAG TPA: hypothetical protein PKZ22_05865 [Accumulibacter sp.]|nr:hypothetical protein [Accumulibacter sp.]
MTAHTKLMTLGAALQKAARNTLEDGWIFLRDREPNTESECLLVYGAPDDSPIAAERGFILEGLDTATLEDSADWCTQFEDEPSMELLLEAFLYYWKHDAWLPHPGAAEPASQEEVERLQAIEFNELLGTERTTVQCKVPRCERGAIVNSSLCRKHHFEAIQKRPYTE